MVSLVRNESLAVPVMKANSATMETVGDEANKESYSFGGQKELSMRKACELDFTACLVGSQIVTSLADCDRERHGDGDFLQRRKDEETWVSISAVTHSH